MKTQIVHGWNTESKSKTACGLSWIYGRRTLGKEPLNMSDGFTISEITCRRCLASKYLRLER